MICSPLTIFKFQYGATNIIEYQTMRKFYYYFKFQYGATNILIKSFTLFKTLSFKFQYGATNIDTIK